MINQIMSNKCSPERITLGEKEKSKLEK